jgi:hypothetical protein
VETAYENGSGSFSIAVWVSVTLTIRSACSIRICYKSSSSRHNRAPQHTVGDGRILLSVVNPERSCVTERRAKDVKDVRGQKYP